MPRLIILFQHDAVYFFHSIGDNVQACKGLLQNLVLVQVLAAIRFDASGCERTTCRAAAGNEDENRQILAAARDGWVFRRVGRNLLLSKESFS
jgi:hypothetical protein